MAKRKQPQTPPPEGGAAQTDDNATRQDARTDTVRIASDLAHKLSIISIRRRVSVSDILTPQLREWVEKLYQDTVREMCVELEQSQKSAD